MAFESGTAPSAGPIPPNPQWRQDLDQVGFVRKIFMARKWYGGDWWFVMISAILLIFVLIIGVFPQWFAPYNPRAEVGPSLLSPGQKPLGFVLIVQEESGVKSLKEIATNKNNIGYLVGTPASQALRDALSVLTAQAQEEGQNTRFNPRPRRFEDVDEGLKAVEEGTLDGFILDQAEAEALLPNYPALVIAGGLKEGEGTSFILGTNQIGQDIFSRIIWGTRIALMVGLSSALVAVVFGVPLGLLSGFVGGNVDRVLTLIMDSIYAFPGIILALSIAAVLGPGIGNIIVAIAVVYVPTYFRIVRGQILSIKEDLYVDAARSLGHRPVEILTRYIFPNVVPSIVIIFSVNVADAILTEAGLSFLGLGLPPDTPDWGIDLARGQDYLRRAWWLISFPGLMIGLVTLSFSMLGESLSEILNPRLAEL
jgi:peptide/nickel transport system permease protein